MFIDKIPLEVIFLATLIIFFISMEFGYRIGNRLSESAKKVKEKITSANASAVQTMLGFMLVFSFGIVYSRFDSKKELVLDEANLIRTAWLRSDFLQDQDRVETEKLLINYVDIRINAANEKDLSLIQNLLDQSNEIQMKLWNIAVANARIDMNSDIGALYIEAVNEMINLQSKRVVLGIQARLPLAIWIMLFSLVIFGMICVGYETAINSSSKISWLTPIMILSFSLVICIIASLDRPGSSIIVISQQPLIDLKNWISVSGN